MKIKLLLATLLSLGLMSGCNFIKDSNTSAESIKKVVPIPDISYNDADFSNRTELIIQNGKTTQRIKASSLKIRLMDSIPSFCSSDSQPTENLFPGRLFFDYAIDLKTGDIAVGVLINECADVQYSAVFILKPQDSWRDYEIYPVQLPKENTFPDKFSSYSFGSIWHIGFVSSNLIVQHGDMSGFTRIDLFAPSETPAREYLGCTVTSWGEVQESNTCP